MTTATTELTLAVRPQLLGDRPQVRDARVRARLADLLALAETADARGHHRLAAYYRDRVVAEVWGPAA